MKHLIGVKICCFFTSCQEEKAKTTGEAWFNMKAPELNKELKGDLKVLQMRGSLDSKRFYKKNDRDGFPKYFQVSFQLRIPPTEMYCGGHNGVHCVSAGWHGGGQSGGLLSFPSSQEGQEENHGGGAAGRCRVQTVSSHTRSHTHACFLALVFQPLQSNHMSSAHYFLSSVALQEQQKEVSANNGRASSPQSRQEDQEENS